MKYKILKAKTSEELETLVNEHLGRGWRPFGDVQWLPVPGGKTGIRATGTGPGAIIETVWIQVLTLA